MLLEDIMIPNFSGWYYYMLVNVIRDYYDT